MKRYLLVQLFAVVLATLASTIFAQGPSATIPLSEQEIDALNPSRQMLETGWNVANAACVDCHGLDGISNGPGKPHLAGQRSVYLFRVLKAYKQRERHNDDMNHAIGFLSEDALQAVSAYYASLPTADPESAQNEPAGLLATAGGDPFAEIRDDMKKCVRCHGEDGNATASGMPNLTAQHPSYFVRSMQAYREGGRSHRLMGKLAAELGDDLLLSMGTFYAVQEPVGTETKGDGNVDLGRSLSESCGNCHGADGNPSGNDMPTLAGQDARYFIKAMEEYKEGKRGHEKMFDAVDELSDEDIQNLATYYAHQDPIRRNVRTPLTTTQWIARCERCHGIDGNSTDPRFPMLAGQDATYLEKALRAYASESRGSSAMHAMSDPLSESDIGLIANHYARQEPRPVVYMQLPCADSTEE